MAWYTPVTKFFGSVGRKTGRGAAKLWHMITPSLNRVFKELLSQAGEQGWAIINDVVGIVEGKGSGVDKLATAKVMIKDRFEKAKISMTQRGINLLIEFAVNLLP